MVVCVSAYVCMCVCMRVSMFARVCVRVSAMRSPHAGNNTRDGATATDDETSAAL